jgi:hypothetical protein
MIDNGELTSLRGCSTKAARGFRCGRLAVMDCAMACERGRVVQYAQGKRPSSSCTRVCTDKAHRQEADPATGELATSP